jgi:hypothetical protein
LRLREKPYRRYTRLKIYTDVVRDKGATGYVGKGERKGYIIAPCVGDGI